MTTTQSVQAQSTDELKKQIAWLQARVKELETERDGNAVVVSYDAAIGKLTVRMDDKDRVLELKPKTHVHDPDGYEVTVAERPTKLKAGVRVEVVEEGGRLFEINIRNGNWDDPWGSLPWRAFRGDTPETVRNGTEHEISKSAYRSFATNW